jgi:hypothetical protein
MSKEVRIIAKTIEGFEILQEALKDLPIQTLNRVSSIEKTLLGFECSIPTEHRSSDTLYFPKNVRIIQKVSDKIYVYCDPFVFILDEKISSADIKYNFI